MAGDIEIKIKTLVEDSGGENSISGIRKSIKALKSEALSVGEGKKGFKELQKAANELQDKLDDLKDSSKSLQGSGIEKLKSSFGLLTDSFKNADFGKAKTAFKGLGSAMKAIPIFLLLEGIMYLVENFEKLSQGSGFLAKALQFVGDIISKVTEGITWLLDKLGLVNAELDKQSENLTKNAEKGKEAIEKQNTAFDQQIAILKANGKSTVALEVEKQNAIIATNRLLIQQSLDLIHAGGKLTKAQEEAAQTAVKAIKQAQVDKEVIVATAETTSKANRKKHNEEVAADKKKAEEDAIKASQEAYAYAQSQMSFMDKERADFKKENEKDLAKEIVEIQENFKTNIVGIAEQTAEETALINKKHNETEAAANEAAFQKKVANINKYVQAIGAALNSVVGVFQALADLQKQEAEQDTKEREAKLNVDLTNLSDARDKELEKEGLTADQKKIINDKYAQQEYELKLLEYTRNTEVKKKAFEQDKKLKIAQTVISTITGAVAAFTGMIQAIPGPVGIILGAVAAAATVAMGAIQIKAISKQKFDAGSPPSPPKISAPSTGGDAAGGASQDGPSLKRIGRTPEDVASENGSGQRQGSTEPQKVYVVSSDITTSQNQNAVLERRSSF